MNILDGNAEDLVAECTTYEQRIKDYGGVELFLAGIGEDGHIAFNASRPLYRHCHLFHILMSVWTGTWFVASSIILSHRTNFHTGSSLASRTRIKTLAYGTILANARFFDNDISAVPRMALTVGVATVLDSKEVVVVVTGQRKALALSKAIGKFVSSRITSLVRNFL